MNVLVISHKYPPSIGGMEKHCFELVKALEQSNKVGKVYKIILAEHESRISFFWRLKSRVKNVLDANTDIDVIYLNDGLMTAFSLFLLKITDIPVVATIHGLDIVFPWEYFQNRIVPKMRNLNGVIAVSDATRKACIDKGFDGQKLITIANGVDHDLADTQFQEDILIKVGKRIGVELRNKKIIITLGRPVKRKGFSWFVKYVMPRLDDDIIFLMVGPRSEFKSFWVRILERVPHKIRSLIELFLGLPSDEWLLRDLTKHSDNVFELGKLPFFEVLSLLHYSDLFVMPNIHVDGDAEGFGLVALEAAICETTVIASGIEGITQAIHDGKNGILLESRNIDAWTEAINRQLSDKVSNGRFARSAKEYTLNTFGWRQMTDEYIRYFERIKKP